jgi:antitoxin component YwqK of YwqJK toxin-antitoxin module
MAEKAPRAESPSPSGAKYVNADDLSCKSGERVSCALAGRPVDGLVGVDDADERGRKYLKTLYKFSGGYPTEVALNLLPNGRVKRIVSFADGYREGPTLTYYDKASPEGDYLPESLVFYARGQRDGMSFSLDEGGRLTTVVDSYSQGKINGVVCSLYPDGSVRSLQEYAKGDPLGRSEEFSQGERSSDYHWAPSVMDDAMREIGRAARPLMRELRAIQR